MISASNYSDQVTQTEIQKDALKIAALDLHDDMVANDYTAAEVHTVMMGTAMANGPELWPLIESWLKQERPKATRQSLKRDRKEQ